MGDNFQEVLPVVEDVSKLLECPNWTLIHDSVGDRHALVLGPDTDNIEEIEAAAVTALRELE